MKKIIRFGICLLISAMMLGTFASAKDYTEVEAFVVRLYEKILNRECDGGGLSMWADELVSGRKTGVEVAEGFVYSKELEERHLCDEDYIEMLYETFLNRGSDESGRNTWKNLLSKGMSRSYVFKGFAMSDEFTQICEQYKIIRGDVILSEPKDQNENVTMFVYRCYQQFLGRRADGDGLNVWVNSLLTREHNAKSAAAGFVFSDELANMNLSDAEYIKTLYRGLFDREADNSGLEHWMDRIQQGDSRADIFEGFAGSLEFKNLAESFGLSVDDPVQGDGYAAHGKLQVSGNSMQDSHGNTFSLKGISTHGIAWFPQYVNSDTFGEIHDWGGNLVRLAMYTQEYGGYTSGGDQNQLKALIDQGVLAAAQNDMYVVIDWHILSDGNPLWHTDEAVAFFDEMSAKYAGYDNVIYEICNEPNGGTSWGDIVNYANQVIPVIRSHTDAIVLVGTPTWSQDVDQVISNPLFFDNVMYTCHFYAATHTDWLRNRVQSVLDAGIPIFVSEFGICDASGNGGIDYGQSQQWMDFIRQNHLSYAMWSLSNKAETASIIQSWCQKTSGWSDDELSETGRWLKAQLGQ